MALLKRLYARPKRRTLVATVVERPPPQKRKKKKKNITSPSFSLLPDEIFLHCLARTSKSHYRSLSLVSKSIRSLLSSQELYKVRSRIGNTEPCLYLCQELPTYDRWYTLDHTLITNGYIKDEFSLSPIITPSSSDFPSKSTTLAVGFEIYQMGGTINNDKRPSSAVRVLDCRTHTWRDAPDMTVARKRTESAFIDGKIYVIGGTEESMKNWPEVFDLKSQTWKPLPRLSDDAKVELYIGELHATTKHKRYAYDSKQGTWKELLELGLRPEHKSVPWCVIENVKFIVLRRKLMWFDSGRSNWFIVEGLEDLSIKHTICYHTTIHLANHGGKIVLLWDEPRSLEFPVAGKTQKHLCKNKRFWCAVVKLEKRIGFSGLEIWGVIERSNAVLTVPNSYKFLSCITL